MLNSNIIETTDSSLIQDGLAYKDEVSTKLIEMVNEYLTFSSTKDLIKLIAANF